jgi:hypothetical protein
MFSQILASPPVPLSFRRGGAGGEVIVLILRSFAVIFYF